MMILLTLLLFVGTPQLEEVQVEEMATVVIYHQRGYYSGTRFDLWLDNIPLARPLRRNSSVAFQVPAGGLSLIAKVRVKSPFLRDNEYVIEVESGKTYYLRADLEYVFPTTRLSLTVSNSQEYAKVEPKLKKTFIPSGRPSNRDD